MYRFNLILPVSTFIAKSIPSTQRVWVFISNLLPNIFVYTFGKKKHYEYSYKFYYTTIGFNDSLSLVIVFNVEWGLKKSLTK